MKYTFGILLFILIITVPAQAARPSFVPDSYIEVNQGHYAQDVQRHLFYNEHRIMRPITFNTSGRKEKRIISSSKSSRRERLVSQAASRKSRLRKASNSRRVEVKSLAQRQRDELAALLSGGSGRATRVVGRAMSSNNSRPKSRVTVRLHKKETRSERLKASVKKRGTSFRSTTHRYPNDRRKMLKDEAQARKDRIKAKRHFSMKTRTLGPPPPFRYRSTQAYKTWNANNNR